MKGRMRSSGRRGFTGTLCAMAAVTGILGIGAGLAEAGWTSIGPFAEEVSALVLDPTTPTTLYAGTSSGGLFKTTDGGTSWSSMNAGLACGSSPCYGSVLALALDPTTPTTLYEGTTERVFKSTDGGENWRWINEGLTCESNYCYVTALALDRPKVP